MAPMPAADAQVIALHAVLCPVAQAFSLIEK